MQYITALLFCMSTKLTRDIYGLNTDRMFSTHNAKKDTQSLEGEVTWD
jgi:hypothetical protein